MSLKISSLIVLIIGVISISSGQQLLFHKSRNKEAIYEIGDIISFSTTADDSKMTSQILGFEGDTLIVFQNYKINPAEITCMYVDDKTRGWYILKYKIDKMLFIAGMGYPLLELLNEGIINRNVVSGDVLIIGGALIGAGLLARWLISKKITIKGRRKLLIITK